MISIPFAGPRKNLFDEIVAFDSDVMWSVINGEMPAGSHI
jgi:hypothetical protein